MGWCNAITGVSVNFNRQNICWDIDLPLKQKEVLIIY